jgi:hypothetical protein
MAKGEKGRILFFYFYVCLPVILGLEEIEFLLDAITRVGHGEFQLSRWRRRTLSMQNNKNKQKKML